MNIKLVVFDLAGTTVEDNKDVHRVLQGALKNYGVDISIHEANEVMGIPKPVAIKKLLVLKNVDDTTDEFINEVHELFMDKMIEFYRTDAGVSEKEGVTDTFRKIRNAGIKIGVDTGFDRSITDMVLARMGWLERGLVDVSVTSDEVERGRPHPDLIYKAMQMTGIRDVLEVAKVGDTTFDLEEGNAARCGAVIGITSGAFSKAQLETTPHTHLIDQIPDLLPILNIK